MSARYRLVPGEHEGFDVVDLVSDSGLVASYAPGAGMVCFSLRWHGEELLGQQKGLRAYAEDGVLMGIPLLHPWANRLARRGYVLGDVAVTFPDPAPGVHEDENGLPIHGLMAGCSGWVVEDSGADRHGAWLVAGLDLAARPELLGLFPFPHRLGVRVTLRASTLRVETVLFATGDVSVPVAFGYHPYFRLPGVPREQWEVTVPVRRRMLLDERTLPTGVTEPVNIAPGPLGQGVFDDLFQELEPDPCFVLAGGERRIEVAFGAEYPVAVVYAPADDDVVCFEPMTAPTNPFEGGCDLVRVESGEQHTACFQITVS